MKKGSHRPQIVRQCLQIVRLCRTSAPWKKRSMSGLSRTNLGVVSELSRRCLGVAAAHAGHPTGSALRAEIRQIETNRTMLDYLKRRIIQILRSLRSHNYRLIIRMLARQLE